MIIKMADETFTIPTIDIGPYLSDPPSSPEAAKVVVDQVRQACMTTGFFCLTGHCMSRELQRHVFAGCEKLFSLPLEEKRKLRPAGVLKNRGYELIGAQVLREGTLPDLKEGFFISQHIPSDDERALQHPYFLGPNIFPANLPDDDLKAPCERYYREVFGLGCEVMKILAAGLGYGEHVFDEFLSNDPAGFLRLLHYPPQREESGEKGEKKEQLGAGAHTDFGAITLLMQDDAGGLEVLNNSTGEWVPIEPNPDAFVVNIGDMLALWTKGVYKSNYHRVINRSGKDRYSVAFFLDGNLETQLKAFGEDEQPAGAGGAVGERRVVTVEEHMLERLGTTYGRAAKSVLSS
ncbi:hypothetical protein QBC46DRAFT_391599 [Diplogelasinospora grovesii]|uniref:Fe2OG dioxygenase domain-containing protein n=1 Tax=Diplogelasinospora grovesii TaxID=303347 RepID=A0AAN6N2A9_9PEZI|nr:hypothetical protein QBC46DRAFT_391599 [Diplogelasinospora grovesii]